MKWYDMRWGSGCTYVRCTYVTWFGVEGVRRPAVVSVFGEDRLPLVRGSFGLAGEEVI